jgi:hypothetical protein
MQQQVRESRYRTGGVGGGWRRFALSSIPSHPIPSHRNTTKRNAPEAPVADLAVRGGRHQRGRPGVARQAQRVHGVGVACLRGRMCVRACVRACVHVWG